MRTSEYLAPDAETAYDRYADMLFRLAYAQLSSRHDAEDVVADVFVKFMDHPPILHDAAHEKSWFLRVALNRCHDLSRRKTVRAYTPLEEMTDLAAKDPASRELLQETEKLPQKYKDAILLHYFEDLSVEETAAVLRITKAAVKMRLMRGRELLRAQLEGGMDNDAR